MVKQVERVLAPHGRFVVIVYARTIESMQKILNEAGFVCTVKPLSDTEMDKTAFLKWIKSKLEKEPEQKGNYSPVKIVAFKK